MMQPLLHASWVWAMVTRGCVPRSAAVLAWVETLGPLTVRADHHGSHRLDDLAKEVEQGDATVGLG